MQNKVRSELLLKTFDGSLTRLSVKPKCMRTAVEFRIEYYDYDGDGSLKKAKLIFREAIAVDAAVNYFDNFIGAELFGFYEIFGDAPKKALIEKIFLERRAGYLLHGDYDYDPQEAHDLLNWREPIEEIYKDLDRYHLYQQQTQGGIYMILAAGFSLEAIPPRA